MDAVTIFDPAQWLEYCEPGALRALGDAVLQQYAQRLWAQIDACQRALLSPWLSECDRRELRSQIEHCVVQIEAMRGILPRDADASALLGDLERLNAFKKA